MLSCKSILLSVVWIQCTTTQILSTVYNETTFNFKYLSILFFCTWFYLVLKVDIWTLRSFSLIEQCPGPSSRCDHTSWFPRLELQRAGDSPHTKWKFSWGGTRTTDHRINAQESYHRAILTLHRFYEAASITISIVLSAAVFRTQSSHCSRHSKASPKQCSLRLP